MNSFRWMAPLAVALLLLASVPTPAGAAGTQIAAGGRCNSRMIGDYQGQIRHYDAHPPGSRPSELEARYGEIDQVLTSLNQEREILENVCTTDGERAPLFAQIAASAAWGLALQADIAGKLNAACPGAAKALPAAMLAQAWLDLANVVNDGATAVPGSIVEVVPKIQSRAQAIGFALPAYADTSAYWRDQTTAAAKAAVQACAPPAPSPSPSGMILQIVLK